MKTRSRVLLFTLTIFLVLASTACVDMGEGEDEDAFYDYFSKVYLISPSGKTAKDIDDFNPHMSLEESEDIREVADARNYAYIAFKVADDYTLTVDEFAFFFKGEGAPLGMDHTERMVLDFYISPTLPTKIRYDADGGEVYLPEDGSASGSDEVYIPETNDNGGTVDRPGEVDESIFDREGYAKATVHIGTDWSSAHLEFDTPQTVSAGEYIVIRIRNNCIIESNGDVVPEESGLLRINLTINYLIFRFTSVKKT